MLAFNDYFADGVRVINERRRKVEDFRQPNRQVKRATIDDCCKARSTGLFIHK